MQRLAREGDAKEAQVARKRRRPARVRVAVQRGLFRAPLVADKIALYALDRLDGESAALVARPRLARLLERVHAEPNSLRRRGRFVGLCSRSSIGGDRRLYRLERQLGRRPDLALGHLLHKAREKFFRVALSQLRGNHVDDGARRQTPLELHLGVARQALLVSFLGLEEGALERVGGEQRLPTEPAHHVIHNGELGADGIFKRLKLCLCLLLQLGSLAELHAVNAVLLRRLLLKGSEPYVACGVVLGAQAVELGQNLVRLLTLNTVLFHKGLAGTFVLVQPGENRIDHLYLHARKRIDLLLALPLMELEKIRGNDPVHAVANKILERRPGHARVLVGSLVVRNLLRDPRRKVSAHDVNRLSQLFTALLQHVHNVAEQRTGIANNVGGRRNISRIDARRTRSPARTCGGRQPLARRRLGSQRRLRR